MSRYANYLLSDNDLLNNKNVYRCDIILYSIISQQGEILKGAILSYIV